MEHRLCLSAAPGISNLGLQNDTGEGGDNVTTDPTVTGTLTNDENVNSVEIEIDFNADGAADDWVYGMSSGSFVYDPSGHINYGQVTIAVRSVEMDFSTTEMIYGEWVSLTYDYESPFGPPAIASLSLLEDTGDPGDDATENPALTGSVLTDGLSSGVEVEIEYNGDGIADDWISAQDGSFSFDPSNGISFGQVTIAVRAIQMDPISTETLYGEWASITFDYQSPPNDPPSITSLSLANDTGEVGDNVTQDPTLTGATLNDGAFDGIEIEVDYNADGVGDDWAYINADGTFEFNPGSQINVGQVTFAVRAVEMDANTTEYLYGEWASITFTYEAPPNDPLAITNLTPANDSGQSGDNVSEDPLLAGMILNDGTFDDVDIEVA